MSDFAPIVLFTYNRLASTRATVEALGRNAEARESDLIVFSDGAKVEGDPKVAAVREYLRTVAGFRSVTVHEAPRNKGLAQSIIDGVTQVVNERGRVIVLEDDLVTSPHFLRYMNDALAMYEKDDVVCSIHGYNYPIAGMPPTFFIRGADCWGWATWKRAWALFEKEGRKLLDELVARNLTDDFDFWGTYGYTDMLQEQVDGKNSSWAVRWLASTYLKDKVTLYPGQALVQNIGFEGDGTHCARGESTPEASSAPLRLSRMEPVESLECRKMFADHFRIKRQKRWHTKLKQRDQRIHIFFNRFCLSWRQAPGSRWITHVAISRTPLPLSTTPPHD